MIEDKKPVLDVSSKKHRTELLESITRNVLSETDIGIARDNTEQLTRLLQQEPYVLLTELLASTDRAEKGEPTVTPAVIITQASLDPFANMAGLIDRIENEDKSDFENPENPLPGLGKLVRRALYLSIEYRVARNYLRELKSDPNKALETLGQDVDLFSGLDKGFTNFIDAVDLLSKYAEKVIKNFNEQDLFNKLEIPILISLSSNTFNIMIGGATAKIRDDENHVIDDKGIGIGYISSNSFMYNRFPEYIPQLLEIKKRVDGAASNLKTGLTKNYDAIVARAKAISPEYAEIVVNSLSKYIEIKKDQQMGMFA